ncbi:MAG TPA: hypothetical protein VM073_00120 [Usitatibacter sp.]|nr:hypothetical protein [Usitatibacter sp.]
MKATRKLLLTALALGGTMLAVEVEAQSNPAGRGSRGATASPRSTTGSTSGSTTGDHGGRHWNHGDHSGHGRWHGGHRWHGGYRHWYPSWGFYFGVPVFWSAWYWGGPYWHDYYPGGTVVYRGVERGAAFPEGEIGPATTEVPRGERLPAQGPLYMNYCESAKAYFPKVTTCPEGWKLATPTS